MEKNIKKENIKKEQKQQTTFQKTLNIISMLLIVIGILLFIFDYFGDIFDSLRAYKKSWSGNYNEAAALRLGLTRTNIIRTVLPYIFIVTGFVIIYFNQPSEEKKE